MAIAAVAGGESAGATGEGESRHRRRGERRHYRRKIAGITGGASTRIAGGATVGGDGEGEPWCDRRAERCSYGRGERRSNRRDGRWCRRRGRAPELPEGEFAGVTGGGER